MNAYEVNHSLVINLDLVHAVLKDTDKGWLVTFGMHIADLTEEEAKKLKRELFKKSL